MPKLSEDTIEVTRLLDEYSAEHEDNHTRHWTSGAIDYIIKKKPTLTREGVVVKINGWRRKKKRESLYARVDMAKNGEGSVEKSFVNKQQINEIPITIIFRIEIDTRVNGVSVKSLVMSGGE